MVEPVTVGQGYTARVAQYRGEQAPGKGRIRQKELGVFGHGLLWSCRNHSIAVGRKMGCPGGDLGEGVSYATHSVSGASWPEPVEFS